MIFTIKRASDSFGRCAQLAKPCENVEAISVIAQTFRWDDPTGRIWEPCPNPLQIYIIRLETWADFSSLIQEVGTVIIYESPYEATPGRTGDSAPWSEPVRGLDGEPLEILNGAHSIVIYDDYIE